MLYEKDLGCRYGQPHDFKILFENQKVKWEVCQICNMRKRYNKAAKGRTDNREYLKDHVRNFCQPNGPTKRIYHKIYKPETTVIVL